VWSWGSGESGQLGNGRKTYRDQPERCVSSDITCELFTDVACGTAHVLALTENGNLFVWGLNAKGQLGLGDCTSRPTPIEMELPNGHEIAKIYASNQSSAAITRTGQNLLTWGSGKDYRLMHKNEDNLPVPTLVERFREVLVAKFCFAEKQSLALARTRLTKVANLPSHLG
jgi:large repetitive protein